MCRGLSLGRIIEAAIQAEFKEEANTRLAVLNDREKARSTTPHPPDVMSSLLSIIELCFFSMCLVLK